ncbi:MAG: fused MFS/spermidine synthase [Planctomycetes bacterium]|nr:fused MFS/spermidine synthase [Planctomycetota bacterium]
MIRYAATIFLSAFLLFQVQPLISRYILPWFGGTPAVWSVALLFFQGVLLAGYAYAHFATSRLKPAWQLGVHLVLLGGCVLTLPIIPPEWLKPDGTEAPTLRILLLLGASVGLPYFALSSTGPLVQAWFNRSYPKKSPYVLYALSNIGSLLALLSYPFVVEPLWGRETQAVSWSWLFGGFALLCAVASVTAFARSRKPVEVEIAEDNKEEPPPEARRSHAPLWICFAACGTALLMAYTNQLCLDVASVPFLWVLPLSLYLLSFILTFAGERWYPRPVFMLLAAAAMAATILANLYSSHWPLWANVSVYMGSLFVLCMICHGEAFRLRPPAKHLTRFYLSISLGGVLGGAFVALVAPYIFSLYVELPAGILVTYALLLIGLSRDPKSKLHGGKPRWAWGVLLLIALGMAGGMGYSVYHSLDETIEAERNFYGVLRVKETPIESNEEWNRKLYSGTTLHGIQFMSEDRRNVPTAYYGIQSGVGIVLGAHAKPGGMRVGVVGLGVGTVAAYAQPGDVYRFYEINPRDVALAQEYFTFLKDCRGKTEVVVGDARLQLEQEEPQQFDVLVLDAFSSDSIPVHLLTLEAFQLYRRHLAPDGVICVHISNRYLNLAPIVSGIADRVGLQKLGWTSGGDPRSGTVVAEWIVLTDSQQMQLAFEQRAKYLVDFETEHGAIGMYEPGFAWVTDLEDAEEDFPVWTDDYSNLFRILK